MDYIREIAEAMSANHAAVMIGAGFSKNADKISATDKWFKNWNELSDMFYDTVYGNGGPGKEYNSSLRLAQEVEVTVGRPKLERILKDAVPDEDYGPSEVYIKLMELPWRDVFTTNYDTLLERAADKVSKRRYNVVVNQEDLVNSNDAPRILKLHAYDTIIANDENKEKFKVILNTLSNLYEASKPEIFEKHWYNEKFSPLVYLRGLFYKTIDDVKVNRARKRMQQILDGSVVANEKFGSMIQEEGAQYVIHKSEVIDLSKINTEELREEIKEAKYKAIEIDDLKKFIDKALQQMLNKNCTRKKFSERYKNIIDRYNAGGTENENYYEQLVRLVQELQKEENRAATEGLQEEELEIYDLLIAGKKMSQADEQKVKLSAKNLFYKLISAKNDLLVVDWYKDDQPKEKVRKVVEDSLDADLPDSYDEELFNAKIDLLMNHFMDMAVQGYGWVVA